MRRLDAATKKYEDAVIAQWPKASTVGSMGGDMLVGKISFPLFTFHKLQWAVKIRVHD